MISSDLRDWRVHKKWRTYKDCIYGEYGEYLFSAIDDEGFKHFTVHLPILNEHDKRELIGFLNVNQFHLGISEYTVGDNLVVLKIKNSLITPISRGQIENMLKEVTDFFKSHNIISRGVCSLCSSQSDTEAVFINNVITRICPSCHQRISEETEGSNPENKQQVGNYLTGILGAFLGGAIGTVLWIVVGNKLHIVASIIGYLIGMLSFKGYVKLKGRIGKQTKWIIASVTLFWIVAAELIQWGIFFAKNDIIISFSNYIITFTNPKIAPSAWGQLGMSLLMGFLGIRPLFTKIKMDYDSRVPKINRVEI